MKRTLLVALAAALLLVGQDALASYMSEVLADSPLVYYQFNETTGTVAADSSGNGNDGTYVGSPTLGASSVKPALDTALGLDGVDDCVSIPDLGSLEQVSIEMLVKWTGALSPQGYTSLVSTGGWDASSLHFVIDGNDSTPNPGTPYGNTWGPNALDTEWRHLAATLDATTDAVTLYVDGAPVASNTHDGLTARGLIGAYIAAWNNPWSGALERHLPGTVDEVAIYGTALSAERIAAHAAAVPEPSTVGLLICGVLAMLGFGRRGR